MNNNLPMCKTCGQRGPHTCFGLIPATPINIGQTNCTNLGEALSDHFDNVLSFVMTSDMLGVPESTLSKLSDTKQPNLVGLSISDKQWMIDQCLVDGVFNQNLFDSKFPTGPIIELYPGDAQFQPEYGYVLIHSLENK